MRQKFPLFHTNFLLLIRQTHTIGALVCLSLVLLKFNIISFLLLNSTLYTTLNMLERLWNIAKNGARATGVDYWSSINIPHSFSHKRHAGDRLYFSTWVHESKQKQAYKRVCVWRSKHIIFSSGLAAKDQLILISYFDFATYWETR